MKINEQDLAAFLKVNLQDCGHFYSYSVALLIANIVIDYLSLQGYKIEDYEDY